MTETAGGPDSVEPDRPVGAAIRVTLVRFALVVWGLVGLIVLLWLLVQAASAVRVVLIPLVLALFPAALFAPVADALKRRGFRPALAALLVVVLSLVALGGVLTVIGVLVADELGGVVDALEESYDDAREWVDDREFGFELPPIDEVGDRLSEWASGPGGVGANARDAATLALEIAVGSVLLVVVLFFYLKDGARIAAFLRDLVPARWRHDAAVVASRAWNAVGAYFRSQLLVALVDAVFIGIGLVLLGVPLALPLAAIVFFGGLFPIVGAFVSGLLAALVALSDAGLGQALLVVVLVVAVQQLEGNVLEPFIVGRATTLHPLAVLVVLAAGGAAFGLLGAFLAVPVTAAVVHGVGYLRDERAATPDDALVEARVEESRVGA